MTRLESHKDKRFLTIKDAAFRYSVSADWLYRTKEIKKVKIGSRLVRIDVDALEAYFSDNEV